MRTRIARKFIFYIILFSSAITLVTTAIQLYGEYRQDLGQIRQSLSLIETGYVNSLTQAVWLADRAQIQLILKGIIELPDIEYAFVRLDKEQIRQGLPSQDDAPQILVPLHYTYNDRTLEIGKFGVAATLDGVYDRLLSRLWIILLSNAVKTTFVAVFIYLLFARLVGRHLTHIAEFSRNDALNALTRPLKLDRRGTQNDELNFVVHSINDLRSRLHDHVQALDRQARYLSQTLDSIGDAVIVTDAEGKVTRMNPIAEQLTGWCMEEAQGRVVKEILPIVDATTRMEIDNPVDKVLASGEVVHLSNHTTLIARDGTEYQISDSAAPIRDGEKILGMVLVFNDVTDQYRLRMEVAKSRRDLQAIMDHSPALIWVKDLEGRYMFVNSQCEKVFRVSSDEVVGKKDDELFPKAIAMELRRSDEDMLGVGHALEADDIVPGEHRLHTYTTTRFPLRDENEEIYAICGISRDTTRSRQAEARFKQLVESTSAIPWEMDLVTWRFTYVGHQAEAVLGYPVEDWYAEGFWQAHIHPEDRGTAMNVCTTATERGEDHEFEYRMLAADGRVVWLSDHVRIVRERGKVVKLQGFMFDITERKESQRRLEQSEAKFRALFSSTSDAIGIIRDGVYVDCNPAVPEMFACRKEDLIGASPLDFSPPTQYDGRDSVELAMEKISAAMGGEPQRFDWLHQRKDGSLFDAEIILNRIEYEGMTCIQGTMRDISARRRQEEAVRGIAAGVSAATGEAFFSNLILHLADMFDAAYAFVGVLDDFNPDKVHTIAVCAHGKVTSNFSYTLPGTPCANVVGQTTCSHPTGVQEEFPNDHLLTEMGVDSYIGSPLFDGQGRALGLLVVMDTKPLKQIDQDVELMEIFAARTGAELERLRIEEDLRESQRLLQLVLDSIPVRVFWKDRDSVYMGCNRNFARDAGLDEAAQLIGKTDFELGWAEQAELYRSDDRHVMESGVAKLNFEEPQGGKDGSLRWLRTSKIPLRDMEGRVFGVLGIYEDVTEQKHTEEVLRRSQKMEAIGQLSGGVAHDFNNQLGVIIGYLDFLRNHHREDDKQRQWVETATRATLRCMDLTRQLLAFSRRQAHETRIVDINFALRELENMISRSLTPEVEVQYELADDAWQTEIDPGEFQDAILNLVINARDAMPRGGRLRIETGNLNLDTEKAGSNADLSPGDYVQLVLTDTGTGMDNRTLEHAFEPFFTTKPEGKGTGLGLAMVYGFARRYGGNVEARSEEGVGTTIRLYLPRAQHDALARGGDHSVVETLPGGNETILVVDDEEDLLRLAEAHLRELGYQTYAAENAAQAMAVLEGNTGIDLLFSDVVMPGGMNGYELARAAVESHPGLRVLLTSGFTSRALSNDDELSVSSGILAKPYRKEELARRVRQVLDAADGGAHREAEKTGNLPAEGLAGHRFLVVDDEEDMCKLFELKLERLGCQTTMVASGEAAIVEYRQAMDRGRPYDAVILDLTLPGGMGGVETAAELHALDAGARLIVTSGDPAAEVMRHPTAHGFVGRLEKDADVATTRAILEQVFNAGQ